LKGAETDCALSDDSCFGARWHELPHVQQGEIVTLLFEEPDPDELVHKLVAQWGLRLDQAENIASASLLSAPELNVG
jgi:hypothetical protein